MTASGDRTRRPRWPALRKTVSGCLLVAMAPPLWQLATADWSTLSQIMGEALIAPVTAAGNAAVGVRPARKPAAAGPQAKASPMRPVAVPAPAVPPIPPADQPGELDLGAPAAPAPVVVEVEREMGRLLEELRTHREHPVAAPPQTGAELARGALAVKLDESAKRLETLTAHYQEAAAAAEAASAAEIIKPKVIFENMKPADAAAILNSMDEAAAAQIFAAMEERKAAAVMAVLPADRAARIALAIKAFGAPAPKSRH